MQAATLAPLTVTLPEAGSEYVLTNRSVPALTAVPPL